MESILVAFVAILLGIWNYNYFDNFIVSKLYRIEKPDASKMVFSSKADRT